MEKTKRMRKTRTEIVDKTTANPFAVRLFTCCAYAVAARARKVRGKEKAHHATLNSFIDFLKSIGRLAYFIQHICPKIRTSLSQDLPKCVDL